MERDSISAPWPVRVGLYAVITMIVGGGLYLWAVRGHAVLLDMAASAIAFICQ